MIIKKTNIVGFITWKHKFLILRRSLEENSMPGVWEMSSGGVEKNESKEDALIREVMEETDIDIGMKKSEMIYEDSYSFVTKKGDTKEVEAFIYKVGLEDEPQIKLSDEHIDFAWCSYDEKDLLSYFERKDDLFYRRVIKIKEILGIS